MGFSIFDPFDPTDFRFQSLHSKNRRRRWGEEGEREGLRGKSAVGKYMRPFNLSLLIAASARLLSYRYYIHNTLACLQWMDGHLYNDL